MVVDVLVGWAWCKCGTGVNVWGSECEWICGLRCEVVKVGGFWLGKEAFWYLREVGLGDV